MRQVRAGENAQRARPARLGASGRRGVWRAKRYHHLTHVLTANTLAGLAEQIQHDYAG